jgi:hypothetical protein
MSLQHDDCGGFARHSTSHPRHLIHEVFTLSHSHLAIRHLIRQIDEYAARRQGGRTIPDWLTGFIQHAAELFEPFRGMARPGFECAFVEARWEISIFLGKTERVGGPDDGAQSPVNFSFDVQRLIGLFDEIQSVRWNAFPDCGLCAEEQIDLSFLVAEGVVSGEPVALQVLAGPPEDAGPALKQYGDGSYVTF